MSKAKLQKFSLHYDKAQKTTKLSSHTFIVYGNCWTIFKMKTLNLENFLTKLIEKSPNFRRMLFPDSSANAGQCIPPWLSVS